MGTVGRDLTEIAFFLGGIALVTFMIVHSSGSVSVFKGAADAFGGLLKTVTFQNQYGASAGSSNGLTY